MEISSFLEADKQYPKEKKGVLGKRGAALGSNWSLKECEIKSGCLILYNTQVSTCKSDGFMNIFSKILEKKNIRKLQNSLEVNVNLNHIFHIRMESLYLLEQNGPRK